MASFDVRLDIGQEDLSFVMRKQPDARFVPVKTILKTDDIYALSEELVEKARDYSKRAKSDSSESNRLANIEVGKLANQLKAVIDIKSAHMAAVEIDDKIDLTQVAEIFTRLNTRGTRVQQSDIYLGVLASENPG